MLRLSRTGFEAKGARRGKGGARPGYEPRMNDKTGVEEKELQAAVGRLQAQEGCLFGGKKWLLRRLPGRTKSGRLSRANAKRFASHRPPFCRAPLRSPRAVAAD